MTKSSAIVVLRSWNDSGEPKAITYSGVRPDHDTLRLNYAYCILGLVPGRCLYECFANFNSRLRELELLG